MWSLYHQHRQSHHSAAWDCPACDKQMPLAKLWLLEQQAALWHCLLYDKVLCTKLLLLAPNSLSFWSSEMFCFNTPGLSKSRDFEFVNTSGDRVKQKPFFSQKEGFASEETSSDFHPFGNQGELGCKYRSSSMRSLASIFCLVLNSVITGAHAWHWGKQLICYHGRQLRPYWKHILWAKSPLLA